MKRAALLPLLTLLAAGAGPSGSFTTASPLPNLTPPSRPAPAAPAPPGFTAAPTPNQDADLPQTRASGDTAVTPGFFTRRDQYRGEGLSPSSSAQTTQNRRAAPGGGISLTMPLQ